MQANIHRGIIHILRSDQLACSTGMEPFNREIHIRDNTTQGHHKDRGDTMRTADYKSNGITTALLGTVTISSLWSRDGTGMLEEEAITDATAHMPEGTHATRMVEGGCIHQRPRSKVTMRVEMLVLRGATHRTVDRPSFKCSNN
jgi:hypothetical protein